MLFRVSIHTGPSFVDEYERLLQEAGFDTVKGTEHVLVDVEALSDAGACWNTNVQFRQKHGRDLHCHLKSLGVVKGDPLSMFRAMRDDYVKSVFRAL